MTTTTATIRPAFAARARLAKLIGYDHRDTRAVDPQITAGDVTASPQTRAVRLRLAILVGVDARSPFAKG